MKRLKVALGACLAMLVAFTALAWAATQYKTTIKVNGTKLNVQRYVEGKGPMKDKAVLLNKDNKVVVRWKQRELKKWYYDGDKYFRFVPYSYDMKNLKPGRYRLVTTSSFGKVGEVYNVGGHNERPNIFIVKTVIAQLHDRLKDEGISEELITHVADRLGHDRRYGIDPTKIKEDLGWYPETPFEKGIVLTIDWYLAHPDWMAHVTSGDYQKYYEQMYKNK